MLTLLFACAATALPQDPRPSSAFALPLLFERHAEDVYLARAPGHVLRIDSGGAAIRMAAGDGRVDELRVAFAGGGGGSIGAEAETPCKVHRYLGNDSTQWRRDVPTFARVRQSAVWPGIDVVWHGRSGALEYDFVVAPSADPSAIRLSFGGALRVEPNGDLVQSAATGEARHRAPVAWQTGASGNEAVSVRYVLGAAGEVAFTLGEYDRARELVIDPILVYMARLDGIVNSAASDNHARIAVDSLGHAIVAFRTTTGDMPLANPLQGALGGTNDIFVAKFDPTGAALVFATYLGGAGSEVPGGVAVLPSGEIAIACTTASSDFPLQNAAFPGPLAGFSSVAGVTVLSPSGALLWSTYFTLTTATNAPATDVSSDAAGNVVVCGRTNTLNLPMTGFQTNRAGNTDAYVVRFSSGGSYLGGTYFGLTGVNEALDVAVAPNGKICVGGRIRAGTVPIQGGFQAVHGGNTYDAWIAVFDATLAALTYSTYAGGSHNEAEFGNEPLGLAVDAQNRVAIASATTSNNFPVSVGAWQTVYAGLRDGFVTMVDPAQLGAASLVFSTYLGGSGNDGLADLAFDDLGNLHVGGSTRSTVLPFVHQLRAPSGDPTFDDALVAVLDPTGSTLRFASTIGSQIAVEGLDLAADGSIFVAGSGVASSIPVTPGAFSSGGSTSGSAVFVARVDPQLAARRGYGVGHPGTLGVPSMTASADPLLGTTTDLQLGNSLGQTTVAALLIGLLPANTPTPFGGTLLVDAILFAPSLLVAPGGASLPLAIPMDNALGGVLLFVQQAAVDAGASQGIAFSAGLQLDLGI